MSTSHVADERISQLIDGSLDPGDAATLRAHLDSCAACSALADDLVRLRDAARSLGPVTPPRALTQRVAEGLRQAGQIRSASRNAGRWRWLQRAAAAVAIVGLPALVALYLTSPGQAPPDEAAHPLDAVTTELELALTHYERAITQLELVTASAGESLDADVVAAVEASLQTLDRAIADSRGALQSDPANEAARLSLLDALRQKVDVLQATARLLDRRRTSGISQDLVSTGSLT